MLIIRREQLQALQASMDRELVAWIAGLLREEHRPAVEAFDDARLLRCVADDVARAHGDYAMDDGNEIVSFVVACFTRGARFDRHPRLHALLRAPGSPAGARMDLLLAAATEADWDEIRRTPAWFERPHEARN